MPRQRSPKELALDDAYDARNVLSFASDQFDNGCMALDVYLRELRMATALISRASRRVQQMERDKCQLRIAL